MTAPRSTPPKGSSEDAQERAAKLIGRTISDRYKILDLLAMGGMGAVYRAEHLLMRKHVAVKVLHPETAGFPTLVARFEREAVAGAHVNHPNVVSASDFGVFDGDSRFLVLEFVRGTTLRELMRKGPVPPMRATRIVRQIAAALTAVHAKGIVHRDVKPLNVMLVEDTRSAWQKRRNPDGAADVVKLIDFGLSRVPVEQLASEEHPGEIDRALTAAGVIMGTIGYLAPEAAFGMGAVNAPADLYSLGAIFYEMLCGEEPFEGNDLEVFSQHRSKPVPPMSERNPDVKVPPELEAIVRRLLEKDPDRRYADANALIEVLDAVIAADTTRPVKSPTPLLAAPVSAAKEAGIGPQQRAWLLALLVVVGGVVAVILGRSRPISADTHVQPPTVQPDTAASAATPEIASARPPRAASVVDRLRAAADGQDSASATAVFVDLADTERAAFADREVQTEAARAADIAAASGRSADAVFDRLSGALGPDGLDILYDLATRAPRADASPERAGGPSPMSARARARVILGRSEFLARATPAIRIAQELRAASCSDRTALFARAASDGDDRALEILKAMTPPRCSHKDACCSSDDRELEHAIAEIQARLRH